MNGLEQEPSRRARGLGDYVRDARRRIRRSRPLSFYLLLLMALFVVVAGVTAGDLRANPQAFFWFLAIHFVFFLGVMVLAIRDCGRILRRYVRERHEVYPSTLGDVDFARDLGERVKDREGL
jgi:membrane protein implicated in regulation of membrane protease activity